MIFAAAFTLNFATPGLDYRADAVRLTQTIEARYWIPKLGRYAEFVAENGERSNAPAFAWDMAVQMSALAAAGRADKGYLKLLDKAQEALDTYGSRAHGVLGYAVLPRQKNPDRYYDDNEWIALAQLDAYETGLERHYLDLAKQTFNFVLSGESEDLGGGI